MKRILSSVTAVLLACVAIPAAAQGPAGNVACPVDTPYVDQYGDPVSFEEAFGPDVIDRLQCNKRRSEVKMVMQVNAYKQGTAPYGFRNLKNIINDLEITHGVKKWKIAIVVHSGGNPLVLDDPAKNEFIGLVEGFIAHPNVDVYYCLNTAWALGHTTGDIIPGVKFVPAGLSSIMDFQYQGYKYIQP